jgi:aspartate aminotransferase-like enzyme
MANKYLFTPGPTPVPEQVVQRMSEPIIYHRSKEFREIFARVNGYLQTLFQTKQPVMTLTSSGTGGMEAIIVNLFSAGDKVISVNAGKFGERWSAIGKSYGLNVVEIKIPWGETVAVPQIIEALSIHPDTQGVLLTHCETSTGTTTDVKSVAEVVQKYSNALVIVDGISAIGALEFRFDEWGIDACVTASQKGLMIPPGLTFIALSNRAEQSALVSTLPKYYFDLNKSLIAYENNDTPWTPAITLVRGLEKSLQMLTAEGMGNVWMRHERISKILHEGLTGLGLKIFSKNPSFCVTAVFLPDGIEWGNFNSQLLSEHNIIIAPGQAEYFGKIFRIAHIGNIDDSNIKIILSAIEIILGRMHDERTKREIQ